MENEFYITVLSDASSNTFPTNSLPSFQVQLAQSIKLERDQWEVGLCEISYSKGAVSTANETKNPGGKELVFVYCDIIKPQLIGDAYVKCLRIIQFPEKTAYHNFQTIYYLPVEKTEFQVISVEITTKTGELAKLTASKKPTMLVLHFKKRRQFTF